MTNVNIFTIIGRLTADAEEFTIGNNTYVGFRVAVDRGQNKETSFIPFALRRSLSVTICVQNSSRAHQCWPLAALNPAPMIRTDRKSTILI